MIPTLHTDVDFMTSELAQWFECPLVIPGHRDTRDTSKQVSETPNPHCDDHAAVEAIFLSRL